MQNFKWWRLAVPSLMVSAILTTLWLNQGKSDNQLGGANESIPTLPLATQSQGGGANPSSFSTTSPSNQSQSSPQSGGLADPKPTEIPAFGLSYPSTAQFHETTSPSTPFQFGVDSEDKSDQQQNWTPEVLPNQPGPILPMVPDTRPPTNQAMINQQELRSKSMVFNRFDRKLTHESVSQSPNSQPQVNPVVSEPLIRTIVSLNQEIPAKVGDEILFTLLQPVTLGPDLIPANSFVGGEIQQLLGNRASIKLKFIKSQSKVFKISGDIFDSTVNQPGLTTKTKDQKWITQVQTIQTLTMPILTGQSPPPPPPRSEKIVVIPAQSCFAQFSF